MTHTPHPALSDLEQPETIGSAPERNGASACHRPPDPLMHRQRSPRTTEAAGGQLAPLGAVFGAARSGTTWLGAMINSHPQVAYRFEPFHRRAGHAATDRVRALLLSDSLCDADLDEVYELLRHPHPMTKREPFFPKSFRRNRGIGLTYRLSRARLLPAAVFSRLYTPFDRAMVIFKEVSLDPVMANLARRTSMPIVYIVRHPVAVCASELRAQAAGKLPTGRQRHMAEVLGKWRPDLLEEYAERLEKLSLIERNALLWRMEVETGLRAGLASDTVLTITYEALAMDPLGVLGTVLEHFGLVLPEQTAAFVTSLEDTESSSEMFSVRKNPTEIADRWRSEVGEADQNAVLDIVRDSPAFAWHRAACGAGETG